MCNSYFKMKIYYFLTFVAAMVLLACGQAHAGVNFNDFSSTAGLTLNGNAAGNVNNGIDPNPVLRLAPAQTGQRGSAFTTLVENIAAFNTTFQFRITNPGGAHDGTDYGADGITFTIQGVGDTALGGGGGGLGYLGIGSSVAVEFDTWNNWDGANDLDSIFGIRGLITMVQHWKFASIKPAFALLLPILAASLTFRRPSARRPHT
jgi:hypothetical protein